MRRPKRVISLGVVCVMLLLTAYFEPFYLSPFAAFCFVAVALLFAFAPGSGWRQLVAINLAAAIGAVGLFDLYTFTRQRAAAAHEGDYPKNYFRGDEDLGYAIRPGPRHARAILRAPDQSIIYDVTYGIDKFGLRNLSEGNALEVKGRPAFFVGDSFVFGEGVEDNESLPRKFSASTGIPAVNFGVHGYGPHQVLREAEIDRFRSVEPQDPLAIIYILLPTGHGLRAAGHAEWDATGPRYEIIDGNLKYVGPFEPPKMSLWQKIFELTHLFNKSSALRSKFIYGAADNSRLLAIVLKIRDLASSKYRAPFIVVEWDVHNNDSNAKWIYDRLVANNVRVLRLSSELPQLNDDRYYVRIDGHPTSAAYALIAEKLAAMTRSDLLPAAK